MKLLVHLLNYLLSLQVVLAAADAMLGDEGADPKANGLHGAEFLQRQLGSSRNISVLTHCNTGR